VRPREVASVVGVLAGAGLATITAAQHGEWLAATLAAVLPLVGLREWWVAKRNLTPVDPDRILGWVIALVLATVAMARGLR
jgi:hypothetical protein